LIRISYALCKKPSNHFDITLSTYILKGATTTTATTTMGGTSFTGIAGGGASTCIDGDETPPEIRFIETEL
jgi:hypothetical protein